MRFAVVAVLLVASAGAAEARGGHGDQLASARRSHAAKADFKRQQPCPATGKSSGACPGYVVDHVKPLACGGADAPSKMQWQTRADAKAKDRVERRGC